MSESRTIDLGSGIGLVVASMVGTGVLVSNGYMVQSLASWQVFAVWIVQALLAIAGAVAYASIAARIPRSGGEYRYLSELVHPALGYFAGWTSLLVGFAAPVASAAFAAGSFAERAGLAVAPKVTAIAIVITVTLLQMGDMRTAKWSQNLFVLIKGALFLLLVAVGLASGLGQPDAQALPAAPVGDFARNLFYAAYAFSGWNAAIYAAEEFRHPRRDVARSMIVGVLIVTVLYFLVTALFVVHLEPSELDALEGKPELSVHLLVQKLIGSDVARLVSVGIIAVLVSLASATMFVGPRVNAAMARDGYLPRIFVSQGARPRPAAFAFQGVLALVLLMSHSLQELITGVGIVLTLVSGLVTAALLREGWRRRRGDERVSTLALVCAAIYTAAAMWMLYYAIAAGESGAVWMVVLAGAALGAYALGRASRRSRSGGPA